MVLLKGDSLSLPKGRSQRFAGGNLAGAGFDLASMLGRELGGDDRHLQVLPKSCRLEAVRLPLEHYSDGVVWGAGGTWGLNPGALYRPNFC